MATPRVLIVEDDEVISYSLARMLIVARYTVATATDFNVAFQVLDDGEPLDLMLADV